METVLTLGNNIRLRAHLDEKDAFDIFNELASKISGHGAVTTKTNVHIEDVRRVEEVATAFKSLSDAAVRKPLQAKLAISTPGKLIVFACEHCGDPAVVKMSPETNIGDIVTCRCGYEMQIREIKQASGDCPNCETKFYNMSVINGGLEIPCRNCKSIINLVEKKDGTLTGVHNLKY